MSTDMGHQTGSPFFRRGGVDMGGFPTDPYGSSPPDMGGFPGNADKYWGYVSLLNHWSGFDGQVVKSNTSNLIAQPGWDSSQYVHFTNGTPSGNGVLNYIANPWGNATAAFHATLGPVGGPSVQFGPAPELIVGTQDFCIEFQYFVGSLRSGIGQETICGQRDVQGLAGTITGNWSVQMKNTSGTSFSIFFVFNDTTTVATSSVIPDGAPPVLGTGYVGQDGLGNIIGKRWFHFVYCRQNGLGFLFVDDKLIQGPIADNNNYTANVGFGGPLGTSAFSTMDGYLSELRLTIGPNGSGAARYADPLSDTRQRGRWPEAGTG